MSFWDSLKESGADLLTSAGDTISGGAKDWLTSEVGQWASSGQEVATRPETIRGEDSPRPDSGDVKASQEQFAGMAANLGQAGTVAMMAIAALVIWKVVK
ncbi:MAG: hypothetical protein CMP77_02015 [Flavobacterium sp.]|nr:hypothetical protein [Flavobacterium sp.]MBE98735.1 hypothetical protein [Flavobacterium sp.]|tara:strand:+ start:324 stop:623 length:300 start_codon:yes stop_codon:yes gene_type:complete